MATRKTATKAAPAKAAAPAKKSKATAAPAKAAPAPKAEAIEYGSAWLVDHVNAEAGTSYTASTLRILLRKLTKEGVLDRDSEGGRQRYNFPKGAADPQVRAIVKAVKSGGAEKAKAERLEDLKSKRTKKTAAPAKKSRKAAPVEVDEEDDDLVDDEI
jgi:predicted transcriptional regulator